MFSFKNYEIKKKIRDVFQRIQQKKKEMDVLLEELRQIQDDCPHPSDRREVVTNQGDDWVSCENCGKLLSR